MSVDDETAGFGIPVTKGVKTETDAETEGAAAMGVATGEVTASNGELSREQVTDEEGSLIQDKLEDDAGLLIEKGKCRRGGNLFLVHEISDSFINNIIRDIVIK